MHDHAKTLVRKKQVVASFSQNLPFKIERKISAKYHASAGNRTRIDCLEGNHANLYTTDADDRLCPTVISSNCNIFRACQHQSLTMFRCPTECAIEIIFLISKPNHILWNKKTTPPPPLNTHRSSGSKFFPFREVTRKRDAVEENHCLVQ